MLKTAAEYIGVSRAELVRHARSGQTLAQIAVARGKTVEGLVAAMRASLEARLDKAVAAGKISTAQAEARLTRGTRLIERLVSAKLAVRPVSKAAVRTSTSSRP